MFENYFLYKQEFILQHKLIIRIDNKNWFIGWEFDNDCLYFILCFITESIFKKEATKDTEGIIFL